MAPEVKHHGFAHLILIIILFLLTSLVFGGWDQGPFLSSLIIGAQVYGLVTGARSGSIEGMAALSQNIFQMIILFLINLVIFYVISSILIFLWNLLFGSK